MKKTDREVAGCALAALAAFCVMTSGAFAAAPAPAPAKPATPPYVKPLDLGPMIRPTDDPAKVAIARQFIMLYHPNTDPKNINRLVDVYMPRAIAAELKENPKVDVKKFEQDKRKHFLDNAAKQMDNQAHVVSRHFTLQEMKDLSAFFASPLGRKLTAESPRITQEIRQRHRLELKKQPIVIEPDEDEDEDTNKAKALTKPAATQPAKPVPSKSK